MANVTQYSFYSSLGTTGGSANFSPESHSLSAPCAGDSDIVDETQTIPTASTLVSLGSIPAGSAIMVEITNMDETNFVSIGFGNPVIAGTATIKLLPGQAALLPNPSAGLYAIANTAPVKILKKAVTA